MHKILYAPQYDGTIHMYIFYSIDVYRSLIILKLQLFEQLHACHVGPPVLPLNIMGPNSGSSIRLEPNVTCSISSFNKKFKDPQWSCCIRP